VKKRQFIFIMTDTQRLDMINVFNERREMHTPNLDKLVEQGVSFERAYTTQPVCGPARSAIFTGTYPHTNGMLGNGMELGEYVKTLGQRLSAEGVHCGYIGKWHLDGGDYFGDGICPDGWDDAYWYDMRNYLMEMPKQDRVRSRNFLSCFDEQGIDESFTYAHKCSQKAMEFIEAHKDEDFLLVLSYDEPHGPFLAPKEFFEPFKGQRVFEKENMHIDINTLPAHIQLWANNGRKVFANEEGLGLAGCNSFVDYEIGRVLGTIENHLAEPTIMYTSDHGDSMGSHGIYGKGAAMYDEITNIPLIMMNPTWDEKNSRRHEAVSHIDIVPTILDYFDVKKPEALFGESLLSKEKTVGELKDQAFIEFNRYEVDHDGFGGYQPVRCVVKDGYKLVISLMSDDELYDLSKDPQEMDNLIHNPKVQSIRDELHDALLDWMDVTRDPFRGYYWEDRSWRENAPKPNWENHYMTRQRITEPGEVKQLDYDTGLEITEFNRKKKLY